MAERPLPDLQFLPVVPWPAGHSDAIPKAEQILRGALVWFSHDELTHQFPPDWFANPFSPATAAASPEMRHWSQIGDFAGGDIKGIWELARFGWVCPLVRAYASTRDSRYAEAFWTALEDWRRHNPPQSGVHWKCGQEVALRAIAWTLGAYAFRGDPASTLFRQGMLIQLLEESGKRIRGHISYALSQKNNHGVSEAAGLFTTGVILGNTAWAALGRRLLESQARELIYADGSFSQHSTNYHRLMLHDYLWALRIAQAAGQPFGRSLLERVASAGRWLLAVLEPETGRVPNLGANDGAHLFDLSPLGYLDHRPTVQAIAWITEGKRWLPSGVWDELGYWLAGLPPSDEPRPNRLETTDIPSSHGWTLLPDGGYGLWRRGSTLALLRCPKRFHHRPSHADILHLDLWHGGRNLLRDAGTYSYNCDAQWQEYFPSVAAHNTIQFDSHDQMPRLSRFLYGRWPRVQINRVDASGLIAEYVDWRGCRHARHVQISASEVIVRDTVSGYSEEAVLRWRLDPELPWVLDGQRASCMSARISVGGDGLLGVRLIEGWESLYYQQKTQLPVLEARIGPARGSSVITTRIELTGK